MRAAWPAVAFDDMGDSSQCLLQLRKTFGGIAHVIERYGGRQTRKDNSLTDPSTDIERMGFGVCRGAHVAGKKRGGRCARDQTGAIKFGERGGGGARRSVR